MRIHKIRIQNFRGIEDMTLELDPKLTVLVGANNAGKTTVLDALEAIVGFPKTNPVFLDTDFRATTELADVRHLRPIEITIHLVPSTGTRFQQGEIGTQINPERDANGVETVWLKLRASFRKEANAVEAELLVLDPTGVALEDKLARFPFRESITLHSFGADRDLRRGMAGRWTDWRAILNEVRPSEDSLKGAAELFKRGSAKLLKNKDFKRIQASLGPGRRAVGLQEAELELSAAPQDPSEILDRIYVELKLPGAQRGFSAERHGLGTQGALLFQIYKLRIERQQAKEGLSNTSPLLTIEEPEAHLHPTAQRSMALSIGKLPGQVVVTSHSPEFVSSCQGKVALLSAVEGSSQVREVETSDKYFRAHPRAVFARALILTEGFEADLVPIFATAMKVDLGAEGVEIINCDGNKSLVPAWKIFCSKLEIPGVCLADADESAVLKQFHQERVGTDGPISAEQLVAALARLDYFTCQAGEWLEIELARVDGGRHAEAACRVGFDDQSTSDWLRDNKNLTKAEKKLQSLFPGKEFKTRSDLAELEFIYQVATRIIRHKTLPIKIATLITKNGKSPAKIPDRFKKAIQRAVELARGASCPC